MSTEQEVFDTTVGDLYEGALDDSAWDRGLLGLARLVDGEGPALMSINPATGALRRFKVYSYDAAIYTDYFGSWMNQDIRIEASLQNPLLLPVTEAQSIGERVWRRSTIFNEFCYESDCAWTLNTILHRERYRATALVIQATRDRGPFSPENSRRLQPVMPHVLRALEIKDRLDRHSIDAAALRDAVDSLSFGVVMLDSENRVLDVSALALNILGPTLLRPIRIGDALALREPARGNLASLLMSSLRDGLLSDGLVHVARGAQQLPLSLLIAPVTRAVQSWIISSPRWILFVFDPERRIAIATESLEAEYSLSAREAQVAALLAAGNTSAADRPPSSCIAPHATQPCEGLPCKDRLSHAGRACAARDRERFLGASQSAQPMTTRCSC